MLPPYKLILQRPLLILFLFIFLSPFKTWAHSSVAILQYHHVSNDTPPSTSISPNQFEVHLKWLKQNDFIVLPLEEIVNTLKNHRRFSHHKIVAITFDDAGRSVCDIAWPLLKKYKMPFTIFINTEMLSKELDSQCQWQILKEMYSAGLMTPANHSYRHLNMVSKNEREKTNWEEIMRLEISTAQQLIQQHIGYASYLFAYPYGEYNQALARIVSDMGYTGFGQQSGAAGHNSDFSALPRFPVSGRFANMDTLETKLHTLSFPAHFTPEVDNPIEIEGPHNPPTLSISAEDIGKFSGIGCFNSQGEPILITKKGNTLKVKAEEKLQQGRHRYTCTQPSNIPERFYWYSYQWIVE